MKMINDMELELVSGGNNTIEKTVETVANSSVLDTVTDGVSTAFDVLKYILFH